MPTISARASAIINAPGDVLYAILADYRNCHPRILPAGVFSNLTVETGGLGAGTVLSVTMRVGGRTRPLRMRITEPEPGRVLEEHDLASDAVTRFFVEAMDDDTSRVTIETTWTQSGLRGVIERLLAPGTLRKIYRDELENLRRFVASMEGEWKGSEG